MIRTLFAVAITLPCLTVAQTITTKSGSAKIQTATASGVEVVLDGTFSEAEETLQKQMRAFGKMKSIENYMTVALPTVEGTAYAQPIYGMVKQVGNLISVWIGVNEKEWSSADLEVVNRDLERIVKALGVTFHRDKIQKQIDESLRASQAAIRQQQRLANDQKILNNRVEDNKAEKVKLEQALVNNKAEIEELIRKLEKNARDQDSVKAAAEQIQKVVELHRERQRKVN